MLATTIGTMLVTVTVTAMMLVTTTGTLLVTVTVTTAMLVLVTTTGTMLVTVTVITLVKVQRNTTTVQTIEIIIPVTKMIADSCSSSNAHLTRIARIDCIIRETPSQNLALSQITTCVYLPVSSVTFTSVAAKSVGTDVLAWLSKTLIDV